MSRRRARTLRPPAPVDAPCPRRSLCWRRAPSQERGRFQAEPASQRRDWCLRKPPSSRRPQPPRHSWPQRGPRPGSTQPQWGAHPAPGGSGTLGLRRIPSPRWGLCPGRVASRLSLCRCAVPPASLSSRHLWLPPRLLSSCLLSSQCLWLLPCLLSSSLQASSSCVSSPRLLCCPQDRGLGWGLTWHPHNTLIPGPDSWEASDASRSPLTPEALFPGLALGLWPHPHSPGSRREQRTSLLPLPCGCWGEPGPWGLQAACPPA